MLTLVALIIIAVLTLIAAILAFQGRATVIGTLSGIAFVISVVLILLGTGLSAAV